MENDTDLSAEMSEGRWLDYDQLAKLRRIDRPSAIKLATRHRWQRRRGNAGLVQVFVPIHFFERSQDRRDKYRDGSADLSVDKPDASDLLEQALAILREEMQRERNRSDRAEARISELEAKITVMDADLMAAHEATRRAQAALDRYYAADNERKGRGLMTRLRAAWRGE